MNPRAGEIPPSTIGHAPVLRAVLGGSAPACATTLSDKICHPIKRTSEVCINNEWLDDESGRSARPKRMNEAGSP